jgi:hypothetical protein
MDARLVDYLASLGAMPSSLSDWKIQIAQRAGVDVAFVLTRGPEIHLLPLVPGKAMTRRNIMEFLGPLVDKFGYATTRTPLAETDHRLRHVLGFHKTWQDEYFTYWAITKMPYTKPHEGEPPCPSLS